MSSVWTGLSADPERRLRLKQKESDLSMEDSSADFNFYTTWSQSVHLKVTLQTQIHNFNNEENKGKKNNNYEDTDTLCDTQLILYLDAVGHSCLSVSTSVKCTACPPALVLKTFPCGRVRRRGKYRNNVQDQNALVSYCFKRAPRLVTTRWESS